VNQKNRDSRPAVSPARAAAFDILLRVDRESSYASELLHSRSYATLSSVDHALATELVMGVLRWQSLLDSQIAEVSSQPVHRLDPEILITLRLAVYQLHWLTRIPARAAIHESVQLAKRARKRSAAPFVNAVLRKLAARKQVGPTPPEINSSSVDRLAATSAHPAWLVDRWVHAYGRETVTKICGYDQSVPVTTLRLRHPEAEVRLRSEGIELEPGDLLSSARRVRHGDVTKTSVFREGLCVIQDEASQLVAALVGRGENILDCCAAPGGKSLAMADRNPRSQVTAVDLHSHRARLLRQLIRSADITEGSGGRGISVITADARQLPFSASFDRVLADVPCSGTGTLSRNPEIKWRLTPHHLLALQSRQMEILRSALRQVAPRGRLVYSTCSLEREENEEVIEKVLAEDESFRVSDCAAELEKLKSQGELIWSDISTLTCGPYLRSIPGVHPCDGFFAAILEKV
jgi:16S rRNA (cytosine967-C5)-methyltransferase